ncbi:hypothetical protein L7F22_021083 [Adiantum nelumboides]|nr:hypothetical protein [Adiantum nelumboides]
MFIFFQDPMCSISRAHVTPNIAHEVYMLQKSDLANKESILERLTPDMREWAKVEMTMEARYYHGVGPWYNTPCVLISQLVWKDDFNDIMSKEAAKLDALGLNDVEKKKRLDKGDLWAHLRGEATLLIERLQVEGPPLSNSFDKFYKLNLKNHIFLQAFLHLMDTVKSSDTSKKMPELVFSAKRVIYRWIVQCVEEHNLDVAPLFTKEWTNVHDENTIYSTSLLERKVIVWEADNCTWWLDYPLSIIPKQEIELRERFKKESEEYIEETQNDALSPLSHGATQLTIKCSSQAILLNKDKDMEPPSTSRIPTPSSMPATTSSMAPSHCICQPLHLLWLLHPHLGGHYIFFSAYYFLCRRVITWM